MRHAHKVLFCAFAFAFRLGFFAAVSHGGFSSNCHFHYRVPNRDDNHGSYHQAYFGAVREEVFEEGGRPRRGFAGLVALGTVRSLATGVWAGVMDFNLAPQTLSAMSTTLFSFSLLRPMTSEAIAKAKLPKAAIWVASRLKPQKFI